MSHILRDVSTANLVTAIEENVFSLIPAFRHWPRAEVHDEPALKWSMTDIPFPLFNSIFRAQLSPDTIDTTIQSLLTQATARNVPLLWWIGPTTRPTDLEVHLHQHGFINAGRALGMALDLGHLSEQGSPPTGLTVQMVNDTESLTHWTQTCVSGFGRPAFVAEAWYDFMSYVPSDTMFAYLGWLNGKPVATSLLILAAGVAGIYNVVTLPEARRQGIGAWMTRVPLRDAQTWGYKVGILYASDMGAGVYRSLGFQTYCHIDQYVWFPEHQSGAG